MSGGGTTGMSGGGASMTSGTPSRRGAESGDCGCSNMPDCHCNLIAVA
jgi:hypothetical protein